MNVYVLFVDPDNGKLEDIETYCFSSEMAALRARGELIEEGCESVLAIRKLRVSDNWVVGDPGSTPVTFNALVMGDGE